ncbi:MAG: hypothetical protein CMM25_04130 [Rhodospirillaceae bacterium]|nr:hypothetical protein [Rhodospirillaceae bacterium]
MPIIPERPVTIATNKEVLRIYLLITVLFICCQFSPGFPKMELKTVKIGILSIKAMIEQLNFQL